jgi:hypothetical protein
MAGTFKGKIQVEAEADTEKGINVKRYSGKGIIVKK